MPTRREFLLSSAALCAGVRLGRAALAPASVSPSSRRLALFEPPSGCYIGAFILRDSHVQGYIPEFEALTQKKHASYITYVGYGMPFPLGWVRNLARYGAAPHIAFEPNDGLGVVSDSAYLRSWARDAARTRVPIFLRWASEMNGTWTAYGKNPDDYRRKFALVSKIMKEEAPNVAMVWTPFAEPTETIESYYPGDGWVDWVGMNIYSVFVHNGDRARPSAREDPVAFLKFIYDGYAARKPVHVSEYAATVFCKGTGENTVDFAIGKARRFYGALRTQFPRVKSVNWFCLNTVKAGLANNDYSLLSDGRMLATYRELVADPHFLGHVPFDPAEWKSPVKAGTTVKDPNAIFSEDADDLLVDSAAIAGTINQPFVRGLKNGDVVSDDLLLRVQLPLNTEARVVFWKVDDQTIGLSNVAPFSTRLPRARFVEGEHKLKVRVNTTDQRTIESDEVSFVVK